MATPHTDTRWAIIIAVTLTIILSATVVWSWKIAAGQPGTIVLPAGNTYLGPSISPSPATSQASPQVFTADAAVPWHDIHGNIYPYIFSAPTTLKLIAPQGVNTYDLYEIVFAGYDPSSTVLIGLDPNVNPSQSKLDYVRSWWQQFGALKGVASIEAFTNSHGMKGYKARYVNSAGETPNLDIFFEVPGHTTYMIHLANGILDPALFNKIVDSVRWGE